MVVPAISQVIILRTELFSRAGHTAFVQIYYELALASYVDRFPKATAPVGQSYFPKNLLRFFLERASVLYLLWFYLGPTAEGS